MYARTHIMWFLILHNVAAAPLLIKDLTLSFYFLAIRRKPVKNLFKDRMQHKKSALKNSNHNVVKNVIKSLIILKIELFEGHPNNA